MQGRILASFILVMFFLAGAGLTSAQTCTTNPFSHQPVPICGPGDNPGGGGNTIGPEDLIDFVQSSNGSWRTVDVSQLVGAQVLGAPPSALLVGSEYHIYVPDGTTGHVRQFIRSSSGTWSTVDLSALLNLGASSVPTAILTPAGVEHVFVNNGAHLFDFVKTPGLSWTFTDVTNVVGLSGSTSLAPVGAVAVAQLGSDIHVYASTGSHLEEYYLRSGGSWVFTDLTARVGGITISGAPSVLSLGNAAEVYAPNASGHVLNFQGVNFTTAGGTWQMFDQTVNSGGSVRFAGIPYVATSPILYGNSVQIFLNGGPGGVADMECMIELSGQWQTFDLSLVSVNGQSLGLFSQPFTLLDGANVHVYVPSFGGHLLEFFKQPNPANWVVTDVTNITGRTLLGIGTSGFHDLNTGEFHVFGNGQ